MTSDALIIWRWCESLLAIAANATATLPFMAVLTLILGRRGHAPFCLYGAKELASLALWLAPAWPALIITDTLMQLVQAKATLSLALISVFFTSAGMGISLSLLLWLVGVLCIIYALRACSLKRLLLPPEKDSYRAKDMTAPLTALLLACACALAAFALKNWPFAGLPPGMDLWRVAGAIGKHSFRAYFAAMSAGGAIALLLACVQAHNKKSQGSFTSAELAGSVRWCAAFAVAGCLPQLLERWGLALGLWLRGGATILPGEPRASLFQLAALFLLSLALAAWTGILVAREPLRRLLLAKLAFLLLLLGASAPWALELLAH